MTAGEHYFCLPPMAGDTPVVLAARHVLGPALTRLPKLLADGESDPLSTTVHQLRVATRRIGSAVRLFGPSIAPRRAQRLLSRLRKLRRGLAEVRRFDVQLRLLDDSKTWKLEHAEAVDAARRALERDARKARRELARRVHQRGRGILAAGQAFWQRVRRPRPHDDRSAGPYTLDELRDNALRQQAADVVRRRERSPQGLHALRLAVKRLRYSIEVFEGLAPSEFAAERLRELEGAQSQLGAINDLHELSAQLAALRGAPGAIAQMRLLRREIERERDRRIGEFSAAWPAIARSLSRLERAERHSTFASPTPVRSASPPGTRRAAALDVGTNSIRLVIAESSPSGGFRVIEDVKQATRLGEGLYLTGRLSPDAIARSVAALAHMRGVADAHRVDLFRAVGTSAVREASNARRFLQAARREAGVQIQVIDSDHEARLAFASVIIAFELSHRRFVTMDLGGGSAEVVFSSEGLIDRVCKLPLGAVRLHEQHARAEVPGEYREAEMYAAIEGQIARHIGQPPYPVELVVGTGGTFTTLARLAIRRGTGLSGNSRFPFAVRGFELARRTVAELLAELRQMPLEDRRRLPGLSSQRAEIIVPGLAVIERLMAYLGVELLRVHDGGIRDGLLAEMLTPPLTSAGASDAAAEYARRLHFDRDHAEHVARLALRLFDQLASAWPAESWEAAEARRLLHAGALLHDVGIAVDYPAHHRHGYDMLRHADLRGFSRRQSALVAGLARYHRRRGPRRGDAALRRMSVRDRVVLQRLAGILRVADGLDHWHRQEVRDVIVDLQPGRARLHVIGDRLDPDDLACAQRKADVLAAALDADVDIAVGREVTHA